MRLFRMLGVAAEAEGIRLRRELRSTALQAGWIAAAAVFGVAAVATAHVAAVAALTGRYGFPTAAGMVAAGDLVVAVILLLCSRRRPDPVAEEARLLRQTMMTAVTRSPLQGALGLVATQAISAWVRRRR
ncbi:hypothetical protein GXW78_23480 [Roseomonas terrae]|jgi:hypothetical protein|uniref:Phage holin family protein n=1 Tax=Neoroseomonas terrae TaxID=424799 RepID=A0ABS5ENM9_9PROT|nr:hypothetical protein [Neoroseomonas terrae]MBR0652639.1 hypothetical protein [Neoroseomonas terrae]